jgi:hypothetical protein
MNLSSSEFEFEARRIRWPAAPPNRRARAVWFLA